MAERKQFLLLATGDVGVERENYDGIFDDVREELAQADLLFGQLEMPISDRGTPHPQSSLPGRVSPPSADAVKRAGYDVMSFAGNHTMDYGTDAFADTLAACRRVGIELVGAGNNISEARRPVIRTLPDGTRIGFLAYSCITPEGYWADELRCGFAPLRGITVSVPVEHDQPETAVQVWSFPRPDDLDAALADLRALRPQVDLLVLSLHWGVHFTPAAIGYYQKYIRHFAVDAGVDLILGHHAHIMKPIEVYRGVPVIYCMPNFALEGPQKFSPVPLHQRAFHKNIAARNPDTAADGGKKQMPTDSHKSFFIKCVIEDKKIREVYAVPCQLDEEDFHPVRVHEGDPRFTGIYEYLQSITAQVGFDTRYRIEGDAIRVLL